jgi:hypothetical protein
VTSARSVTATFTPTTTQNVLTVATVGTGAGSVQSQPTGIQCPSTCVSTFPAGTLVTLTATPAAGSVFGGWSGACTGTSPTCTVSMSAAASATASFSAVVASYPLTAAATGAGTGTITSSPAGIACPTNCSVNFPAGTVVTLTAAPTGTSLFAGWGGACSGTATTCTVTTSAAQSVSAMFNPPPPATFTLRVGYSAGLNAGSVSVRSSPAGIDCPGSCVATFAAGATVTLTATPAPVPGELFVGWNVQSNAGATGECASQVTTCVVVMSGDKSVNASFIDQTYVLSVSTFDNDGLPFDVTSLPGGIDCGGGGAIHCQASFLVGTVVTLVPHGQFVGWAGDCSGAGACSVTMDRPRAVAVSFGRPTNTLTVTVSGTAGGSVSWGTAGNPQSCFGGGSAGSNTCTDRIVAGTVVTLSANTFAGSTFAGWSGACSGTALTCIVTMDQARGVSATFR